MMVHSAIEQKTLSSKIFCPYTMEMLKFPLTLDNPVIFAVKIFSEILAPGAYSHCPGKVRPALFLAPPHSA